MGQVKFYMSFIFYFCQQALFELRVSSLLSLIDDASVDIVDDEGSFQFSPEGELASPLYVRFTSPLQQTLKQNHRALYNC